MYGLTAAHRNLPFQTWVEVENLTNGKRVDVRINDRGPFVHDRIIDLSQTAAKQIDMLGPGTARVRLTVIATPANLPATKVPDSRVIARVIARIARVIARLEMRIFLPPQKQRESRVFPNLRPRYIDCTFDRASILDGRLEFFRARVDRSPDTALCRSGRSFRGSRSGGDVSRSDGRRLR